MIDLVEGQPPFGKAIFDGMTREPRVVLLAGEPLLLSRGDRLAIDQKRGGAVVNESPT